MSPHPRRLKRTAIRASALGAAAVLAPLAALLISGALTGDSTDKDSPEIQKRLTTTICDAPSCEIAFERANQLLASVENPRTVCLLAYTCSDTGSALCNTHVDEDSDQGEKFWWAWGSCVDRLVTLGQSGDERAAAELWRMRKSGRYDAGNSEMLVTAISQIGRPAIPLLHRKRRLGSRLARELIKAIEKGEILE